MTPELNYCCHSFAPSLIFISHSMLVLDEQTRYKRSGRSVLNAKHTENQTISVIWQPGRECGQFLRIGFQKLQSQQNYLLWWGRTRAERQCDDGVFWPLWPGICGFKWWDPIWIHRVNIIYGKPQHQQEVDEQWEKISEGGGQKYSEVGWTINKEFRQSFPIHFICYFMGHYFKKKIPAT